MSRSNKTPPVLRTKDLYSQNEAENGQQEDCGCYGDRVRQIKIENDLLRAHLEALCKNHGMRCASIVATILSWMDRDTSTVCMHGTDYYKIPYLKEILLLIQLLIHFR